MQKNYIKQKLKIKVRERENILSTNNHQVLSR